MIDILDDINIPGRLSIISYHKADVLHYVFCTLLPVAAAISYHNQPRFLGGLESYSLELEEHQGLSRPGHRLIVTTGSPKGTLYGIYI